MRHIINPERLYSRLKDGDGIVIDCRFALGVPQSGRDAYIQEHIPGAFYLDLEQDLSSPKRADGQGGRHPLPDVAELAAKLTRLGVTEGKAVIGYDDQGGAMASRLWWLLTYMGHDEAYVLNGGLAAWKAAGYPVTAELPGEPADAGQFVPRLRPELLVTAEDIKNRKDRIASGQTVLLDSREEARFRGTVEPLDKKAGHIPGARHSFWKANLDPEGRFRPLKAQLERFEPLQGAEEIIVYCGSGVTACPNVLMLREAGFRNVKLYAGSWSDWISNDGNPIAAAGDE
ncbi:sulfurtransferase [Paenibacillus alkalitolerans]|uniref:sulfurtransferase n=1 Tax=Paenibacillus alkalitolerans TaxID=2799335 RepID=UPI0018F691C0|nr:sulfurtransferase [Paenibacillus alkalitolerans]